MNGDSAGRCVGVHMLHSRSAVVDRCQRNRTNAWDTDSQLALPHSATLFIAGKLIEFGKKNLVSWIRLTTMAILIPRETGSMG